MGDHRSEWMHDFLERGEREERRRRQRKRRKRAREKEKEKEERKRLIASKHNIDQV